MAKQPKYYDISNLLTTEASYMMLLGQRANGKSYQVKKTCLEHFVKTGEKFIYLRRWVSDIKTKPVESYFDDMPIKKITKGKYEFIIAWSGSLYFGYLDEDGARKRGEEIGRYCALNEYERYKSQTFPNYKYIIYEEFITDAMYLGDNEPTILQQFVSTVARNRKMTVFLVGNTLSRVCPYFHEWSLNGVLKQALGTIEVYHYHFNDTDTVDIAVEYCKNAEAENYMFFGQSAKQIVSGEWDTREVNKLPRPKEEYEKIYELLVEYQDFRFCVELLVEPTEGGTICFVYPYTSYRTIQRKITDKFTDNIFSTAFLDTRRRPEAMISECFRAGKVCYSDNLTGADFTHVNETFRIGKLF